MTEPARSEAEAAEVAAAVKAVTGEHLGGSFLARLQYAHVAKLALNGAALVAGERERQIDVEGYKPESDAIYDKGQLVEAGLCYIEHGQRQLQKMAEDPARAAVPASWPWDDHYWKPKGDAERNLIVGAALVVAEIDRILAQTTREERLLRSFEEGDLGFLTRIARACNITGRPFDMERCAEGPLRRMIELGCIAAVSTSSGRVDGNVTELGNAVVRHAHGEFAFTDGEG